MSNQRRTKIIGTIGPASSNEEIFRKLLHDGLDVVRLNMSHATHDVHQKIIDLTRKIYKEEKKSISLLLDIQGPKIRVGCMKDGNPVKLTSGQSITVTVEDVPGTESLIPIAFPPLLESIKRGHRILMNDGMIELKVQQIKKDLIQCVVNSGGILSDHKGVNLPDTNIDIPSLTDKDMDDIDFGIANSVDYFALSFIRDAHDILLVRKLIQVKKKNIPLIAKIEKPEAVKNIDSILEIVDGIMIARGDLGVEMPVEEVPGIQKKLIKRANHYGKIVITATQMLESMIQNPVPTRAEVTDVANAIHDGTDALMLSAETASGKYPTRAIRMMDKVALETENYIFKNQGTYTLEKLMAINQKTQSAQNALAHAAVYAAHESDAKCIIVFTISGHTAIRLSKLKPIKPVYVLTPDETTFHRLSLLWGITPVLFPMINNTDQMVEAGEALLKENRFIKSGDLVIVLSGSTPMKGATNMLKMLTVI